MRLLKTAFPCKKTIRNIPTILLLHVLLVSSSNWCFFKNADNQASPSSKIEFLFYEVVSFMQFRFEEHYPSIRRKYRKYII